MANICGHCKSSETQAVFDTFQCLACGQHSDQQGRPVRWVREGEAHALVSDTRRWEPCDPIVPGADAGEVTADG